MHIHAGGERVTAGRLLRQASSRTRFNICDLSPLHQDAIRRRPWPAVFITPWRDAMRDRVVWPATPSWPDCVLKSVSHCAIAIRQVKEPPGCAWHLDTERTH
jgi:hypothetical protein